MKSIAISKKSAHSILKALGYRVKDMRRVNRYNGGCTVYRLSLEENVALLREAPVQLIHKVSRPVRYYIFITDPEKERRCKDESQVLECLGVSN